MDVLAAGFVLGVGATWLARRRRTQVRGALAWTAHQSGWITGQVAARLAEARRLAREHYESGRASVGVHDATSPEGSGPLSGAGAPRSTMNGGHAATPAPVDLSPDL
jgi:hypothetical protein